MRIISINAYPFFSLRISLLIVLILSIMSTSMYSAQSILTTTVSVFPLTVTGSTGQDFSINVTISNVLDLYGWEFKLSWNATLLDVVNVVQGPFLNSGGDTYFTYKPNATAGYLIADCTLLGMVRGVSGNGILATITFYVKNNGECPLNLYDVILLNSFEQSIPCQIVDGYGYFIQPHDIAVTNASALPLTVLPGNVVDINATVQNQGSSTEVYNVTAYADSEIIGVQSIFLGSGSSVTITFIWNTTGFGKGDYTVSASASVVPGEVDTADNSKAADSIVTILYLGHDVAVISVAPLKTIVGQGYCMFIAVTAKNYGVFSETFDITAYANTTAIQTQIVALESGRSAKLTFIWNTTGFAKGNYTISAVADTVLGETDTSDNSYVDSWVFVTIAGDITGAAGSPDSRVDMRDIGAICNKFGAKPSSLKWNPNYDINNDGRIDMRDVGIACNNFGKDP